MTHMAFDYMNERVSAAKICAKKKWKFIEFIFSYSDSMVIVQSQRGYLGASCGQNEDMECHWWRLIEDVCGIV